MNRANLDQSQITTASFFKLNSFANQWWAFKQMRLGLSALKEVNGLSFYKIFGSGAKQGFSVWPNFSTYVILCVWESEKQAEEFFQKNAFLKEYRSRSKEGFTVYARSAESHGLWDGKKPFAQAEKSKTDQAIMVLTRARIRTTKLLSFWSRVNQVSQSLKAYDGALLSIGVGEWPLIQQATISIWSSQAEMLDYAYKNEKHQKVIQLTRKLNWYSEELFARFIPYRFEGKWEGKAMESFLSTSK
ncbi:MAG: DUF3291 domain-containing protein [Vicingaceae bacterium]